MLLDANIPSLGDMINGNYGNGDYEQILESDDYGENSDEYVFNENNAEDYEDLKEVPPNGGSASDSSQTSTVRIAQNFPDPAEDTAIDGYLINERKA